MTTTADTLTELEQKFVDEINGRLQELQPQKDEYDRLTGTLHRLLGTSGGRAAPRTAGTAPRAPRGRPAGGRLEQFVAVVQAQPGITISEAASKMGVASNYLYRIRDKAKGEGKIRVEDSNLFPTDTSARQAELAGASK